MKILLLRVPVSSPITADMSDSFERDVGTYLPLGLLFLYSTLKQQRPQDETKIIDGLLDGATLESLIRQIQDFAPDVIGITTMTFHLVEIHKCASLLKKHLPTCRIVLGGPHVHLFPTETLSNPDIDYAVAGEGEFSFPQLISALADSRQPAGIPGVFYRDTASGSVHNGGSPVSISDLDLLPPLDLDALPVRRYLSALTGQPSGLLLTSRGCPCRCVYCDRPHMGSAFRPHSPKRVLTDIKQFIGHGIRDIQFFDDTFTLQNDRALKICSLIEQERLGISFSARARVNTVDARLIQAMKRAGCRLLSFGVEAGSNRILKLLRKGTTIEQSREAFALCREYGIDTVADFILGGPEQTNDDVEETIDFAIKLNPTYAQFTLMTPYPGTELYRMGMEKGIIKNDYWREFAHNPTPDFQTPLWEEHLSRAELLDLFYEAYRRFYRRPALILRQLFKIRSGEEFLQKFKLGLTILNLRRQKLPENDR